MLRLTAVNSSSYDCHAAKAGTAQAVRVAALELGPYDIRVNAIALGPLATNIANARI